MTVGAVAAIGVFLWVHSADLGKPSALVKAFDPAPCGPFSRWAGKGRAARCRASAGCSGWPRSRPTATDIDDKMLAAHRGEDDIFGKLADACRQVACEDSSGITHAPDGTFSNVAPPDAKLAEVQSARCFQTDRYSVGDRGLHSVTEQPRQVTMISLPRYLALSDFAARHVAEAAACRARPALLDYFNVPQDDRLGHPSLLRRSRPADRSCALRRSRAPERPLRCCASGSPIPASHRR